jgi:hypothetical protein
VQHHPAGELLVHRLLGVARQTDGVGGLDEVGRRVGLDPLPCRDALLRRHWERRGLVQV